MPVRREMRQGLLPLVVLICGILQLQQCVESFIVRERNLKGIPLRDSRKIHGIVSKLRGGGGKVLVEGTPSASGGGPDKGGQQGVPQAPAAPKANAADTFAVELRKNILASKGVPEVLYLVEMIPAIRNNVDGALKITYASPSDASLAACAMFSLALLSDSSAPAAPRGTTSSASTAANTISSVVFDRRWEQLLECVESQLSNLSTPDLSRVVWSLSVLGHRQDEILEDAASTIKRRITAGEKKEEAIALEGATVANVVPGEAAVGHTISGISPTPTELCTIALSFAYAFVRLKFPSKELLDAVATALIPHVSKLASKDLANCAWGFASQVHPAPDLCNAIAKAVVNLPPGTKVAGKDIANLSWALAVQGANPPALYPRIMSMSLHALDEMTEQDLANLAWGLARSRGLRLAAMNLVKAGEKSSEDGNTSETTTTRTVDEEINLTAADTAQLEQQVGRAILIQAESERRFKAFRPRHLARLLWALAAWHISGVMVPGAEVFARRCTIKAYKEPHKFSTTDLTHILYAFAVLVGKDESPTQELSVAIGRLSVLLERDLASLDSAALCDVLWTFAALKYPAKGLCEKIDASLLNKIQDLSPQSLSRLAWAHASIPTAPVLMERVVSAVENRICDMTPAEVSAALYGFGNLGYTVEPKCALPLAPVARLKSLLPSEIANLAWGLSITGAAGGLGVGEVDREAISAVAQDLETKLSTLSPADLVKTTAFCPFVGRLGLKSATEGAPSLSELVLTECARHVASFTTGDLAEVARSLCQAPLHTPAAALLFPALIKEVTARVEDLPVILSAKGAIITRQEGFYLGQCEYWLEVYREMDFDGQKARGKHEIGKEVLGRMLR